MLLHCIESEHIRFSPSFNNLGIRLIYLEFLLSGLALPCVTAFLGSLEQGCICERRGWDKGNCGGLGVLFLSFLFIYLFGFFFFFFFNL